MPAQYDLFTTNSDIAGYRLNYLEIFNWGTFNGRIYRIAPQGNNSLLTGANASGKSTLIDALLTLLVPAKKDRFYNQSSGIEKKGDRTEETYVLGNYGNIQSEGEVSTKTQQLRDKKNTYSIILASFANNQQKEVTLFQVRWFVNNELKCSYGFSHKPLTIENDFSGFNGSKGDWKKLLEKQYNSSKKQIEFYDTIKDYKDRIITTFGLRSDKALTLFNQIVGVKVLNDLDDFIRNNMLEQCDAESRYIQLSDSFATLMEAQTTIEKVKEQIAQLKPIDEKANQLKTISETLDKLKNTRDLAVYWFAQKNVELTKNKIEFLNNNLEKLTQELEELNEEKDSLREKEQELLNSIANDDIGKQITNLGKEISNLEKQKNNRLNKLAEYNKKAIEVGWSENPSEQVFADNREKARLAKTSCQKEFDDKNKELRKAENTEEIIDAEIKQNLATLEVLQKNKNNISGREAEIRDMILSEVGATSAEIPFIGELVRVKDGEKEWENSIEKILHNFALRLIVPERYYKSVNQFVNSHNLNGRIVYQRYKDYSSLKGLQNRDLPANSLLNKIEFNTKSNYSEWVEDVVFDNYNYACVSNLEEFYNEEKAVTVEGLIKSIGNKHEKDDRSNINRRENYVLGWDNKEKKASISRQIKDLQEKQKQNKSKIREIEAEISNIEKRKLCFHDIFEKFPKYEEINWEILAQEMQEKVIKKQELEATNDKVKALQNQLKDVQQTLKKLEDVTIQETNSKIWQIEKVDLVNANKRLSENGNMLERLGTVDVSAFEEENADKLDVDYGNIESKQKAFQSAIERQKEISESNAKQIENEVSNLMREFKYPKEEITNRFRDWRTDVNKLPENVILIGEYQKLYNKLVTDDLVRFEKQFDDYLQETLTNKVSDFRVFFYDWEKSIKSTIETLNESLKAIDFSTAPTTYIQLVNTKKFNADIADFRRELDESIPNFHLNPTIEGKRTHFKTKIQPLIEHLKNEQWRKKVMDVRSWFSYKAEEFYKESDQKRNTYESMGQLSGGEKAQLTYTILGSAIAYQFGLTKDGLQANSFRFIAIDEAFKAQDEDKARYLISLCKQLHLQLLVVTPSDNIHIVEDDISFVHYVERKGNESILFDMPIQIFKQERDKYQADDNAN